MSSEYQPDPEPAAGAEQSEAGDAVRQLVLIKQGQRYVFRFAEGDEASVLESLIEMARDPQTAITWFDAAVLSHQLGRGMGNQLEQIIKL